VTTDEASDTQAEYGLTAAYGSTRRCCSLVASHSQTLSGLAAGTLYHYRVKSRDAAGNLATSGDFTFVSLAAAVAAWSVLDVRRGSGTIASILRLREYGHARQRSDLDVGQARPGPRFDGLSNYVNVPHAGALDAYPLTIAVWIKTSATTGVRGIVNNTSLGRRMAIRCSSTTAACARGICATRSITSPTAGMPAEYRWIRR